METKTPIVRTGRSLSRAIDEIIRESIKSQLYKNTVDERERQKRFLGEDDDIFGGDDEGDSDAEKPSKTMDSEKEKLKSGEITHDDIVSKLNTIRSGKSFKDDAIATRLEEYIESLSKAEKTALFAFLKGLAQIVTGEMEPEEAADPSNPPAQVTMKKGKSVQKRTIKPNVIKVPSKDEDEEESGEEEGGKKKKKPAEDTTGPVPITPKKK